MPAKIQFESISLDQIGTPQFGWNVDYETSSDGRAIFIRTSYKVQLHLTESSFADNHARIDQLMQSLRSGEGRLLILNESGVPIVDKWVKVKSHEVAADWRQYHAEFPLIFECRESIAENSSAIQFTPTGGEPITLGNITTWKESVRTERHSVERANRRQSIVSISGSGTILADKTLSHDLRRAQILKLQQALRGLHAKDGVLTYSGQSRIVQIQSSEGDIGDGTERLEWSLEAQYVLFPGNEYCEVEYEVATRTDNEAGETAIIVSGEIRTDLRSKAIDRLSALKQQYATMGRSLVNSEVKDSKVDGADGSEWLKLGFTFEMRESTAPLSYSMRISTRDETSSAGRTISYEGRVAGGDVAKATLKARELGLGKLPFMVSGSEVVSVKQVDGSATQFIDVQFTYEYLSKTEWRYAEVANERTTEPFGDSREIITGYAAGLTEELAQTLGRSFQLAGRLQREKRESTSRQEASGPGQSDMAVHFSRFDFSYTYYVTPVSVSISYGIETTIDSTSLERTVTCSGTAYGPSEEECHNAIDALIVAESIAGKRTQKTRSKACEIQDREEFGSAGAGEQLIRVDFTERYVGAIEPEEGLDIIEAEWSLNIVYSVNKDVLTPIPFSTAYVQPSCGTTIGVKTASGSVTALTESAAKTWGKARRANAITGGSEDPPEERTTFQYVPLDGSTVKAHRFEFTYAARFPNLTYS